jgi:hypothetical protein
MAITVNLPKQKEETLVPRELKQEEKLVAVKAVNASSEKSIKPEDLIKESN